MEDILSKIALIITGPIIALIVQLVKIIFKPVGVWIRVCALIIGGVAGLIGAVTFSATGWEQWILWLLLGLSSGLASTGLYENLKNISPAQSNNNEIK